MHSEFPYDIYGFTIPSPSQLREERGLKILNEFPRPHEVGRPSSTNSNRLICSTSKVDSFDPSLYKPSKPKPNPNIDPAEALFLSKTGRPVPSVENPSGRAAVPPSKSLASVNPTSQHQQQAPPSSRRNNASEINPVDVSNIHSVDPALEYGSDDSED